MEETKRLAPYPPITHTPKKRGKQLKELLGRILPKDGFKSENYLSLVSLAYFEKEIGRWIGGKENLKQRFLERTD